MRGVEVGAGGVFLGGDKLADEVRCAEAGCVLAEMSEEGRLDCRGR